MKPLGFNISHGFTLIEMVIAITVFAAGVSGILFSFTQNIGASADPMIRQQAIIIAQSYLEEAMLKPYNDPDGEGGGCEEGIGNRVMFDDVNDYGCINDMGAEDQFGNSFTGLGNYNVVMTVASENIGAAPVTALRIDVAVTNGNLTVNLTGYRTPYY